MAQTTSASWCAVCKETFSFLAVADAVHAPCLATLLREKAEAERRASDLATGLEGALHFLQERYNHDEGVALETGLVELGMWPPDPPMAAVVPVSKLAEADAQLATLRAQLAAVREFVVHKDECFKWASWSNGQEAGRYLSDGRACNCGLRAALALTPADVGEKWAVERIRDVLWPLVHSYECDEPHWALDGKDKSDYYPEVTLAGLQANAASEHFGDCTREPQSCLRCHAEYSRHKAAWLAERLVAALEGGGS